MELLGGREPQRLGERQLDQREPGRLVAVDVPAVLGAVEPEAAVVRDAAVRERLAEAEARVVLRADGVDRQNRGGGHEDEDQPFAAGLTPRERHPRQR